MQAIILESKYIVGQLLCRLYTEHQFCEEKHKNIVMEEIERAEKFERALIEKEKEAN